VLQTTGVHTLAPVSVAPAEVGARTNTLPIMADSPPSSGREGVVYLVGAGPGDPGLVTRRALELISRADVLVHDRLVPSELLDHAPADAERLYVGKEPGEASIAQEEIHELLVGRARAGKLVVRLKGGDPFVFGRGGEEAEALSAAGIEFEVVPGITAGLAAPAYAGIPVTHRDAASAVALVTGHEDPSKEDGALDWAALAAFPGTLVLYMGVRNLSQLASRLIEHGRPADEPAAVIERGSLPGQRVVTGTLGEIADRAALARIHPPSVTVVGNVAALRERLAWFEDAPLHHMRVAVTRARAQASTLAAQLSELGAEVIELPSIRIQPRSIDPEIEHALELLHSGRYDVICLTSPNGARLLLDALSARGLDARTLRGATLAAIGPGTAQALADGGLKADVVPATSVGEALAEELVQLGLEGKRVLVARAAQARDVLPESLRKAGAEVDVVALYDTVREELDKQSLAKLARADYITFTSSSTVRYLIEALGSADRLPATARVVSIGPVTTETAHEMGLRVDVEAEQHDIEGLVQALTNDALARGGASGASPE
jgi:uroporphyrinogen III methyltransferase/synthase